MRRLTHLLSIGIMNMKIAQNYNSPEMVIINIEVEQSILNGSIEDLGNIKEEMDW